MTSTAEKWRKIGPGSTKCTSEAKLKRPYTAVKLTEGVSGSSQFNDLHRAYGQMKLKNFSKDERDRFKTLCQSRGLGPNRNFEKALEDPEPKFSQIIKSLKVVGSTLDAGRLGGGIQTSYPRYKRTAEKPRGIHQNDTLGYHYSEMLRKTMDSKSQYEYKEGAFSYSMLDNTRNIEADNYRKYTQDSVSDKEAVPIVTQNPPRLATESLAKIASPRQGIQFLI